jgi:hypothetical protein
MIYGGFGRIGYEKSGDPGRKPDFDSEEEDKTLRCYPYTDASLPSLDFLCAGRSFEGPAFGLFKK